ncbi:Putative F-box and WD domain protein [Aspergillus calidoustus]|uniref:Probable E3 ubiquitin ligase complex SCF subunit sconB n=1 Tax=Aspergillus calidoustus TaxID=454130 RepID=A0A0U5GR20_ASPCI|nr:Putative F-box and WD domain protein [Aspergillus calidoustus]
MARDKDGLEISIPLRLYRSDLTTPSLSTAPFRLDEGYSDDSRSQADKELSRTPSDDVMSIPEWVLAHNEVERAEIAYNLLLTLRTSTVASVVERLTPLLHMDPVLKLPPEITSEIFSYLDPRTLLTASLASRAWRSRVFDSRLWKDLYIGEGWRVDIDAIHAFEQEHSALPQSRKSRSRYADTDLGEPKLKKRVPSGWLDSRSMGSDDNSVSAAEVQQLQVAQKVEIDGDLPLSELQNTSSSNPRETENKDGPQIYPPKAIQRTLSAKSPLLIRMPNGSAKVDWPYLYRQRRRLEDNWVKGRYTNFQLPHPAHMDEAHGECVYAIQFIGKWLVSGSRDKTVRVWDLETKRLWHRPLLGHKKSVLCLQFDPSPSEDIIVSGSSDKSVIVWRFSTGEKIHEIVPAHDDSVLNLRFDSRYLVTCSKDKLIKVWNRRHLSPLDEAYPNVSHGVGVTYPPYIIDTSEIPSPVLEAEIAKNHIRTLAPYSLLMALAGHTAAVNAIQLNNDEIVSASGDRMIRVWNVRNGVCKRVIPGHEKGIACVQSDDMRIVSGSNDNTVRIFDHVSGAQVACLKGHSNLVRTVQAGFGDPPGSEEALRLEALAVDQDFWDAQRSGQAVDLGPAAMRRAGYRQNTAGSRDPRDINAVGALIPPGGGGSKWGKIVSGSYDESVIIWRKDSNGEWVVSQTLRQADAAARAAHIAQTNTPSRSGPLRGNAFAQLAALAAQARPAPPQPLLSAPVSNTASNHQGNPSNPEPLNTGQNPPQNDESPVLPNYANFMNLVATNLHLRPPAQSPTSRIFKLQFDARKIVCASQDPRIVVWDFVGDDEELNEACQFFTGL